MTETGERVEARGWVEKTRQMSQKRAFDADSSRGLFVPAEYLKPLRGRPSGNDVGGRTSSTSGSLKFCACTSDVTSAALRGGNGRDRGQPRRRVRASGWAPTRGSRSDSVSAVRVEKERSGARGATGTHHSASSLSAARTGASSTEKSSFMIAGPGIDRRARGVKCP